jgi:hypothetical protein
VQIRTDNEFGRISEVVGPSVQIDTDNEFGRIPEVVGPCMALHTAHVILTSTGRRWPMHGVTYRQLLRGITLMVHAWHFIWTKNSGNPSLPTEQHEQGILSGVTLNVPGVTVLIRWRASAITPTHIQE